MKNSSPKKASTNQNSIFRNIRWDVIENNLSAEKYLLTREIVFFSFSDLVMKNCMKVLDSKNLLFKNFSDFNSALRVGIAKTADIVILIDKFSCASHENISKLLKNRNKNHIQVINWNQSSTEELILSIKSALSSINQSEAKKSVVNEIVQSRMHNFPETEKCSVEKRSIMGEKELRTILNKELDGNVNQSPEKILADAIKIIKKLD